MNAADKREARIRAESQEAQENPLYAVKVKRTTAAKARAAGVPIDPNLPDDAKVGILDHSVAYDPKYAAEEEKAE